MTTHPRGRLFRFSPQTSWFTALPLGYDGGMGDTKPRFNLASLILWAAIALAWFFVVHLFLNRLSPNSPGGESPMLVIPVLLGIQG